MIDFLKISKFKDKKGSTGQTFIELIIIMGLAVLIIPAITSGLISSREGTPQQENRLQAASILKETESAVRSIKNESWLNFDAVVAGDPYHPQIAGTSWSLVAGGDTLGGVYDREVVVSDVYRDASGSIVQTGGVLDPSTKKVDIRIEWSNPRPSELESTIFLTRTKNDTFVQTLDSDFNPGDFIETVVTNNSNGEVELNQSFGTADWCKPQDSQIAKLTLPKPGNAIYIPSIGSAQIATGDGGSGESLVDVDIAFSPPPAPPNATIDGTYIGNYQTNAIFSDGNYAYLAINGSSKQVRILNVSSKPYTEVGTITLPSNTNANGIYVDGNTAYVTSNDVLYKVNVTNKNGSHTPSNSVAMKAQFWFEDVIARQVVVREDRVFVAVEGTLFGLQIFKTNDLSLFGVSKPTVKQLPEGLYVNEDGSRAYIAFSGGSGLFQKGFFILNTIPTRKESVWIPGFAFYYHHIVGSYNTKATIPRGMTLAPGNANRALIGGIGGTYQYHVVDISNESKPVFCGGLNIPQGVTGVAGALDQYTNVYSYLLTGSGNKELRIIQGGAGGGGGGGYSPSGTFTGDTFDAGEKSAFNRFEATISEPVNTEIKMHVAVGPDGAAGCDPAVLSYVGPDGTSSTYFTPNGSVIAGSIPMGVLAGYYENPERCFGYKVYFETSTSTSTPVFEDIVVNYSQ